MADGRGALSERLQTLIALVVVYNVGVMFRIIREGDALARSIASTTDRQAWEARRGDKGWDFLKSRRPAMKGLAVTIVRCPNLVLVDVAHVDVTKPVEFPRDLRLLFTEQSMPFILGKRRWEAP